MAKPSIAEYKVKAACPLRFKCSSSGHKMLQLRTLFSSIIVFEYTSTGIISMALIVHAAKETIFEINGVRIFDADIGWHTATYRSALIIIRKILLVN